MAKIASVMEPEDLKKYLFCNDKGFSYLLRLVADVSRRRNSFPRDRERGNKFDDVLRAEVNRVSGAIKNCTKPEFSDNEFVHDMMGAAQLLTGAANRLMRKTYHDDITMHIEEVLKSAIIDFERRKNKEQAKVFFVISALVERYSCLARLCNESTFDDMPKIVSETRNIRSYVEKEDFSRVKEQPEENRIIAYHSLIRATSKAYDALFRVAPERAVGEFSEVINTIRDSTEIAVKALGGQQLESTLNWKYKLMEA